MKKKTKYWFFISFCLKFFSNVDLIGMDTQDECCYGLSMPPTQAIEAYERRLTGKGAPFELVDREARLKFARGPDDLMQLYSFGKRYGNAVFLDTEGDIIGHERLMSSGLTLGRQLRAAGHLRSGDRVAISFENCRLWMIWFVAITSSGACAILVPGGVSPRGRNIPGLSAFACDTRDACDGFTNLADFDLTGVEPGEADQEIDPDQEAVVLFSSGTTGEQKAIVHSHRSLTSGLRNMMLAGAVSNAMRDNKENSTSTKPKLPASLCIAPFWYISGLAAVLLAIYTGGSVIRCDSRSAEIVRDIIFEKHIQALVGAPADLLRKLIRASEAAHKLRSLTRLHVYGRALQRRFVNEIEQVLPNVRIFTGYGLSETAGSISVAPADLAVNFGTAGRILSSVAVRVVNKLGMPLAAGKTGEIEISGPMMCIGYLLDDGAISDCTREHWFRTGDIGWTNEGWLYVIDRADGQLDEGGYRVDVENCILDLAGVDEAILAVAAGGSWEITLQVAETFASSNQEVIELVRERFAPRGAINLFIKRELPMTESGKIRRPGAEVSRAVN